MPRLIAITVYEPDEACEELAKRTEWPRKYSRQRLTQLVRRYLPAVTKARRHYLLTDSELALLADKIQVKKRHKDLSNGKT